MNKDGLEDVIVADSAICSIDGAQGILRYRGYSVEELAEKSSFAETAHLLWHGELPTKDQLAALTAQLTTRRALSREAMFLVHGLATRTSPMDALRTIVSAMCADDDTLRGAPLADPDLSQQRAIRMTARMPTAIAALARIRAGKGVLPPDPELDHAANFLYMLRGDRPSTDEARIFDACLILHAEHDLNASTFAARVTASTLTDIYAAVTAAVGSLKGPLHGGANTAVMEMLLEIDHEENVGPYLDQLFARRQRIMGFGHRVYKVIDPRARVLQTLSERVARLTGEPKWFHLSNKVAAEVAARRGLAANVDFYSASTYYGLGIPPDLYTPIFALARIVGWTAHVLEQYRHNRLMRPLTRFSGSRPRAWQPPETRSTA